MCVCVREREEIESVQMFKMSECVCVCGWNPINPINEQTERGAAKKAYRLRERERERER